MAGICAGGIYNNGAQGDALGAVVPLLLYLVGWVSDSYVFSPRTGPSDEIPASPKKMSRPTQDSDGRRGDLRVGCAYIRHPIGVVPTAL